jgi:hypothetical protein
VDGGLGASLSYPRALVAAFWREPFERLFDERMTGWGFQEIALPRW